MKSRLASQSLPLATTILLLFSPVCVQAQARNSTEAQRGPSRSLSAEELFKRVSPSVFVIEALDKDGSVVAFGSGVAVGLGLVVTNTHVIKSGVSVRLRHGDSAWPASVEHIGVSVVENPDLCVLRVEGLGAPTVKLRFYRTLEVGEKVYAIGAPQGLEVTLSEGLVSGLRRLEEGAFPYLSRDVIQTTAAISPGSSGGGLFDARGQLVGITTFLLTAGQSLNFGIPVDGIRFPEATATCHDLYRNTILAEAAQKLSRMTIGQAEETVSSPTFDDESVEADTATRATRLWPASFLAHYCLGHGLLLRALKMENEIGKGDPGVLVDNSDFHQAIEELKGATRLQPESEEAHDWLATALWTAGDHEGAVRELREAVRLQGATIFAMWSHHRLAGYLWEIGDKEDALTEYRRAYELNPGISAFKGDYERALRELREHDGKHATPKRPN